MLLKRLFVISLLPMILALGMAGEPAGAASAGHAPKTSKTPAASHAPKPAGRAVSATIPEAVSAAIAHGPANVLVGFDVTQGLAHIRSATRTGLTRPTRAAAARAAAAAYATTKQSALAQTGSGVTTWHDFSHLPVQIVRVASLQALRRLASAAGVTSIALPQQYKLDDTTPAWLSLTHQPQAVQAGYNGSGVRVAVLDTGADYQLPAAAGVFGDCSGGPGTGTCRIDQYVDTAGSGQLDTDPDHHGTNVNGIVATVAPAAHLLVYNVFTDDALTGQLSASDTDILAALNNVTAQAAAQNIRAVNMSLGDLGTYNSTECTNSAYSPVFLNLRALGVVPVVAAGNAAYDSSGTFHSGVQAPACATGAVRVGAVYAESTPTSSWGRPLECTDNSPQADNVACFSQTGPLLSLLAPGVNIEAAGVTESGTSQATPNVAGAVADLVSANRQASAQQIVRALVTTGTSIHDPRDGTTVNRLDIAAAANAVQAPGAEASDANCTANTLPANDDGSTDAVELPFVSDFYGTSYSALYVNNNGNVTFQNPQSTYTPFTINANTPPIIAPFFADVDTRGTGSGLVTYGNTTFGSRPAFCVDWNGVGYYGAHADKLDSFQLMLVDRGDVGAGDFDIIMNYGALNWETGDASGGINGFGGTPAGAGYSAGDGDSGHFFQFPGSLTSNGLLDTNSNSGLVNGSRGTLQTGRYIFPVRNGAPPGAARITGFVRDSNGTVQSGSPVQACPGTNGSCVVGVSGPDGRYTIVGLAAGSWQLTALPPAGSAALPGRAGPVALATGSTVQQDITLGAPQPIPPGTTITDNGTTSDGVPIIYWTDPLSLDTTACAGGTAGYIINQGAETVRSGAMTEAPPGSGHFHATIDPLYPSHGDASVLINVSCPGGSSTQIAFSIYIDPSGMVVNTTGAPIAGATVTLLRSDSASGPFNPVPDGSAIMSPSSRTNPETTGTDGIFHWDVLAGFYQVEATKQGCHVPGSSDTFATSSVYEVPPAALGITLTLDCGETVGASATTLAAAPAQPIVGQPTILTATVSGSGAAPTGTVSFSAADGSISGCDARPISAGQATCTVTFAHATSAPVTVTAVYSGDSAHPSSSGHIDLSVGRATPVINWATPGDISYPTALGSSQLNATASVPGSFAYTVDSSGANADGAVLHAGVNQLIDVTFTPDDTADYTSAQSQVAITILRGAQAITADPVPPVIFGTPSSTVTAHGGGSGLPVTFTSSTPTRCTVASATGQPTTTATVDILAPGTCTLTLNQAGTADWAPAPTVDTSFTITQTAPHPTLDARVSADQKSASPKITSPALTTSGANELILAFISADGPTRGLQKAISVTGGGLRWTLASRSRATGGTAEVWQAYATSKMTATKVTAKLKTPDDGSITVAAFTGAAKQVAASGAASSTRGAPSLRLTPLNTGSLVWAAGHNWSTASQVTTPAGQTIVHQFADRRVKDTYWCQSMNGTTTAQHAVMVRDLTPKVGRWELAAIEIAPAG